MVCLIISSNVGEIHLTSGAYLKQIMWSCFSSKGRFSVYKDRRNVVDKKLGRMELRAGVGVRRSGYGLQLQPSVAEACQGRHACRQGER